MKIHTGSWSEFKDTPLNVQLIGISRGTPRGYPAGYRRMPVLAPGPLFKSVSPREYHKRYMAQLAALDAMTIYRKIEILSLNRDSAVLLCFESPYDPEAWCHRAQVSAWLWDQLGIEVREWGSHAYGWNHPKFAKTIRRYEGARAIARANDMEPTD